MKLIPALLLALALASAASGGDYDFDVPAREEAPKKLELSGNLDARYALLFSRTSSPLYKLQYYGQSPAGTLSQ
ncbi:MAG TPA: hypothetical protein DCS63_02640, partial [Elusimicrobia bacterium]|nr:hypothetical protein [Elusimicrobiota bacterium]